MLSQKKLKQQNRKRDPWGSDLMEKGFEFAKDTTRQVVDAVNPLSPILDGLHTPSNETASEQNHSPLDRTKLEKAYAEQDNATIAEIQKKLYPEQYEKQQAQQLHRKRHGEVREEEKRVMAEKEEEEAEEERQKALKEQEEKKRAEEEKAKQAQQTTPKGKVRKSIFGLKKRKSISELPAEVKPGGFKG